MIERLFGNNNNKHNHDGDYANKKHVHEGYDFGYPSPFYIGNVEYFDCDTGKRENFWTSVAPTEDDLKKEIIERIGGENHLDRITTTYYYEIPAKQHTKKSHGMYGIGCELP